MQNLSCEERRALLNKIYREVLKGFKPNVPGNRYSGQQIARAKGIALKKFFSMGM